MGKVQDTITKIMIERIEARRAAGEAVVAPWRMTWDPATGAPRNLLSGHSYRGVNLFMTLFQGYASPFWLTKKQLLKVGGTVKRLDDGKAEPYSPIVFWKFPSKEERAEGRFPFCKFYQVWNTDQISGIENHPNLQIESKATVNPIESAEAIVSGYHGPVISNGGGRACYTPSRDTVSMPEMGAFESAEAYYRVLFHELAHSTGHRNRLARDGVVNPIRFGSHEYSEEELIAEMGAAMLAGHAGIGADVDNSAAYLDTWLKKLKREPGMLVAAGGQAQKAADLIRGIKWENADD